MRRLMDTMTTAKEGAKRASDGAAGDAPPAKKVRRPGVVVSCRRGLILRPNRHA